MFGVGQKILLLKLNIVSQRGVKNSFAENQSHFKPDSKSALIQAKFVVFADEMFKQQNFVRSKQFLKVDHSAKFYAKTSSLIVLIQEGSVYPLSTHTLH